MTTSADRLVRLSLFRFSQSICDRVPFNTKYEAQRVFTLFHLRILISISSFPIIFVQGDFRATETCEVEKMNISLLHVGIRSNTEVTTREYKLSSRLFKC